MKYNRATVTTTGEFADMVSVLLIDMGSEGASVTDYEDVKKVLAEHSWDYADETLFRESDGAAYVSGFYPQDYDFAPLAEALQALRTEGGANAGSLELHIDVIDSSDYENEWKKYYAPIELDRLTVMPAWQKYDGEKIAVYVDPGMAFGTGSHETTKLCLRFLEKEDVRGKVCADVGCGSGILGAAALLLGASSCTMWDIDEQAVKASRQNCARNGVEKRAIIRQGSLPENAGGMFSLITANLTADILIMLKDNLCAALSDGGRLIMSGIIHSRAADVRKAFSSDFVLAECKTDGEWQGMLWQKKDKT